MDTVINTKLSGFILRSAQEKDLPLLLHFIKELAAYEKRPDHVQATIEDLRQNLFILKYAEAALAEYQGKPVGYMIFYHNFSTFSGKPGIYIEDVYVNPDMRGKGMGKIMFAYLAQLARARNCGHLDWSVLRWNESSIGFYQKLGAEQVNEWDHYQLSKSSLDNFANSF